MKKSTRMKKRMAMLLSGVLAYGMVAGMVPGNTLQVQAAATSAPTLESYATKAQLMDSTFAPKMDGTLNNIGKLVFGRNSDKEAQKWYIVGKDNSISVDNTMILACTPIAKSRQFNATTTEKDNQESYYDNYVKESGVSGVPATILANHYGASDLRQFLVNLARDPDYFTMMEQTLMQPTIVNTADERNGRVYQTTDYLYAVKGYEDSQKILIGSYEKELLCSTYFSGENFWLRTAYGSPSYGCAAAWNATNQKVSPFYVNASWDVCPATNLDLSSVLFASAYDTATGVHQAGELYLRLDGSSKNIGSVTYNSSTGMIKAVKGSTTDSVRLVIQFSLDQGDACKSIPIEGEYVFDSAQLANDYSSISAVDLTQCKIWLEITDSDGMIYAVEATEATEDTGTTDVDVPTASVAAGLYTEDQSVELQTATEGATIYFTMDGSEPGRDHGMAYTDPIPVTGRAGESVTTTIQAIAVKDGMRDSEVVTFIYTIELPEAEPGQYQIIDGANGKWTQNSDGSLVITGNGDLDKFQGVKVDDAVIGKDNYTAEQGSTIITLKASYLQTLAVGSHTFTIVWTDGEASTTFTVAKQSNNNGDKNNGNNTGNNNSNTGNDNSSNDNGSNTTAVQTADNNSAAGAVKDEVPKTGDTSNRVLGTTLFMAALAGLAGMFVRTKKKECK